MQTIYLLKGCYKSYIALRKLYDYPDLSTTIIILDKEQAKILLLDRRVKKFPFIINTLPTSIGLIPKIAKVLPLEMFLLLKKFHEERSNTSERIINIPTCNSQTINVNKRIVPQYDRQPQRARGSQRVQNTYKQKYKTQPLVRTVKENDGSVNIILNK